MALKFPDGSVVGFASTISTPMNITAVTNAKPGEVTVDGTLNQGDVVAIIDSKWAALKGLATRIGEVSGNEAELLGINTSDTKLFPAGSGASTGRLVVASDFVDFSQQASLSASGGEPQTYTGKWLEDPAGQEFQIPIGQTPRTYTLELDYDNTMSWYEPAKAITRQRIDTVIRIRLPDGDTVYEFGRVHFNSSMAMSSGTPIKNAVTFYLRSSEGVLVPAA